MCVRAGVCVYVKSKKEILRKNNIWSCDDNEVVWKNQKFKCQKSKEN